MNSALRRSGCLVLVVALGCRGTAMSLDPEDVPAFDRNTTADASTADVPMVRDANDLDTPATDTPATDAPADDVSAIDIPSLDASDVVAVADRPVDAPALDRPPTSDVPVAMDVRVDAGTPVDLGAPLDTGVDSGTVTDVGPRDVVRNDVGTLTAGIGEGLSPEALPERRVTCGGVVPPAPTVTAGAADRFVLRGRVVTPTGVLSPGEVFITGGTITCVAASCSSRTGYAGATVIATGGIIAPGMVDTHNHPQYGFLPPWPPPRRFTRSDQWQSVPEYQAFTQVLRDNENLSFNSVSNTCAMTKWAELRSVISGTTTIQGSPNQNCITRTLARNIESGNDFDGVDTHRPNTLGVATISSADALGLRADMDSRALTAYILHLSEGIDEPARREFDQLVARNLVNSAMVIIHGTALGVPEFTQMGAAHSRLVWSPRSNIILYGRTTNVGLALDAGITVALAPDWSPSGGPNLLSELRYGRYVSQQAMGGRLTPRDLVEMVTSRAAAVVDRPQVGSLVEGRYADVMVIPDRGCDAYESLIDAPAADVRLVVLGGRPVYGDAALFGALPDAARARCEPLSVCDQSKTVCVALASTANGLNQTAADIEAQLRRFTTPYPLVPLCP